MLTTFLQWNDWGYLLLRLVVAGIFIYHGLPKLKNSKAMGAGIGMPAGAVLLIGLVEALGGLAVALGFWIQLAAIGLAVVMIGAIYYKVSKWHVPFYSQSSTGWEYDLILLAVALFMLTHGAGNLALGM